MHVSPYLKGFVKRAYPIVFVIGAWFGIQTRAFSQSYNPYHLVQLSVESPDLALAKANQALELYEEPVAESMYLLSVEAKNTEWRNFQKFAAGMSILPAYYVDQVDGSEYLEKYQ